MSLPARTGLASALGLSQASNNARKPQILRPVRFFHNRLRPGQPAISGFRPSTKQQSPDARVPLLLFDIADGEFHLSPQSNQSVSLPRKRHSFSPNTIRSRLALHYKALKYTASWISYPDIERLWQDLEIPLNDVDGKGAPPCTLPILLLDVEALPQLHLLDQANISGLQQTVQTSYGVFRPVVSSLGIAVALDILFRDPDLHPPLFPSMEAFEQAQQVQTVISRLLPAMRRMLLPSVPDILDNRSREYFIHTRKQWFNVSSLEELRPQSQEETDKLWEDIEDILQPIFRTLLESSLQRGPALNNPFIPMMYGDPERFAGENKRNASSNAAAHGNDTHGYVRYLSGTRRPTYADFILMAFLAWIARVDMNVWTRLTCDAEDGILEDLWMGCLPFLKSHTYIQALPWFRSRKYHS